MDIALDSYSENCDNIVTKEKEEVDESRPTDSTKATTASSAENQLLKCRLERYEDEELRKLEEDRLQEIIRLCQNYNDAQEGKRVRSLRVNEGDRLLELMKKPDVVSMTIGRQTKSSATSPIGVSTNANNFSDYLTSPSSNKTTMFELSTNSQSNNLNNWFNGDNRHERSDGSAKSISKRATTVQSSDHGDNNDDDVKILNALTIEESLIRGEIDDMKHQQFSDAEDEELKEFQRIEREIKLNELYKCLENIERQIGKIKQQYEPTTTSEFVEENGQTFNEQSSHQYNNGDSSGGAPLATCETDESTSSDDDISVGNKVTPNNHHDQYNPQHCTNHQNNRLNQSQLEYNHDTTANESLNSSKNEISSRHDISGASFIRSRPRAAQSSGDLDDLSREKQQRPLTIYLPSTSYDLDLVDHIVNLGHDVETFSHLVQLTPSSCSGYLWKLCSNTENQWRKRYFLFDRAHKVFVYFKTFKSYIKAKKAKYGIFFNQIEDAYVDHNRTKAEKRINPLSGSLRRRNHGSRHVFVVVTSEKNFTLSSFVPEVMRIWIDVIFTGAEGYLSFE